MDGQQAHLQAWQQQQQAEAVQKYEQGNQALEWEATQRARSEEQSRANHPNSFEASNPSAMSAVVHTTPSTQMAGTRSMPQREPLERFFVETALGRFIGNAFMVILAGYGAIVLLELILGIKPPGQFSK